MYISVLEQNEHIDLSIPLSLQLLSYPGDVSIGLETNACLLVSNADQASKRQIAFRVGRNREVFQRLMALPVIILRSNIQNKKMIQKEKEEERGKENITFLSHYNKAIFLKKKHLKFSF